MKRIIATVILTVILIIAIFLLIPGQDKIDNDDENQNDNNNSLEGLDFINESYGYGFNPPTDWYFQRIRLTQESPPGTGSPVFSPFEFQGENYNNVSFSFVTYPLEVFEILLKEPFSFNKMVETLQTQSNVISHELITIGNKSAVEIIGIDNNTIHGEEIEVYYNSIYIDNDDLIFNVYYFAPIETYDDYYDLINASVDSIVII